MSYQEYLVQSKGSVPLEKLSGMIDRMYNPDVLSSRHTIATLRNDLCSDKILIFGRECDIKSVNFTAGQQFLVLTGDRRDGSTIFPIHMRKFVNVYPMETVMNSPQNKGKEYKQIFVDTPIKPLQMKRGLIDRLNARKKAVNLSKTSKDNIPQTKKDDRAAERR